MKKTLILNGLCCAHCAAKIEKAVKKLDGVESCELNFMLAKLNIEASEENMLAVIDKAKEIIRKVEPDVVVKGL